MASYTEHLQLLKKDPVADGADTFNIQTMLNDNWDKIDEAVAKKAELGVDGKVPPEQLPDMDFDEAGSAAEVQKNLDAHTGNKNNPHAVTAAQVGAATTADLSAHTGNRNNPHSVTAQQVGADPAGTAAAVQQALAAQIAALTAQLGEKAEIHLFSYAGTGTYGADAPSSLTAEKPIQFAQLLSNGTNMFGFGDSLQTFMLASVLTETPQQGPGFTYRQGEFGSGYGYRSSDGKTFYWYDTNARNQFNESGDTYYGFYIC